MKTQKKPENHISTFYFIALVLGFPFAETAEAAKNSDPTYIISSFKNGQKIGARKTTGQELRDGAVFAANQFKGQTVGYESHLVIARTLDAKSRCYNLFSFRIAAASIEAGFIDTSMLAEQFFKNGISAIESVNSTTKVSCTMK
jgi:hypothetical protein